MIIQFTSEFYGCIWSWQNEPDILLNNIVSSHAIITTKFFFYNWCYYVKTHKTMDPIYSRIFWNAFWKYLHYGNKDMHCAEKAENKQSWYREGLNISELCATSLMDNPFLFQWEWSIEVKKDWSKSSAWGFAVAQQQPMSTKILLLFKNSSKKSSQTKNTNDVTTKHDDVSGVKATYNLSFKSKTSRSSKSSNKTRADVTDGKTPKALPQCYGYSSFLW